jgi:hypothetical protein
VPLDECLWLKITSALRHSKNFASATMARRSEAVVRRGFACRSWNKASCFRRNRFSAIRATRVETNNRIKVGNSVFYKNLRDSLPSRPNYCGAQLIGAGLIGLAVRRSHRRHSHMADRLASVSATSSATGAAGSEPRRLHLVHDRHRFGSGLDETAARRSR